MQPKESKSNSHFKISLIKSFLRLVGCYFLFYSEFSIAAILLFIAEILGVAEEIY